MKITEFKVVIATSSDIDTEAVNVEDLAAEVIIPQCYAWLKKQAEPGCEASDIAVDCRMTNERTTDWYGSDRNDDGCENG